MPGLAQSIQQASAAPSPADRIHSFLISRPDVSCHLEGAFEEFVREIRRCTRAREQRRVREISLAVDVLRQGRFIDPKLEAEDRRVIVRLSSFVDGEAFAAGAEASTQCALAAAEDAIERRSPSSVQSGNAPTPTDSGTDGRRSGLCTWTIHCRPDSAESDGDDPWSIDPEAWGRLTLEQKKSRILFWAGGIADRHSRCPWIARDADGAVDRDSLIRDHVWERRSVRLDGPTSSLEPIPATAGAGGKCWDQIVLTTLERLFPPVEAASPGAVGTKSSTRGATTARRGDAASVRTRRELVERLVQGRVPVAEVLESLNRAGMACSRSTYFADQQAIFAANTQTCKASNKESED